MSSQIEGVLLKQVIIIIITCDDTYNTAIKTCDNHTKHDERRDDRDFDGIKDTLDVTQRRVSCITGR